MRSVDIGLPPELLALVAILREIAEAENRDREGQGDDDEEGEGES